MKWDIPRHEERKREISQELAQLLAEQTEFFRKGARVGHTAEDLREYEVSRERVRKLFAELERMRRAA
jgi:hypothetical protein